ncbi:MAG: TetR family transcriptional regulator C-terminal domain-containing protein, partial [Actinobacteria bacterium]|nr:TetR family transcriptional regulator C-terminal domain-containing protein [Actinomycetota bacterium]
VAERAGVRPGVVHYHVHSIDELRRLAAVRGVEEFFGEPAERTLAGAHPGLDVAELLAALSPADPQDPRLLLLYESLVAAARDDELRTAIAETIGGFRARVITWLTELGVTDPVAVAVTLTAAIDGYLLQRALDPTLDPAPLVTGLRLVLGGFLPSDDGTRP